MTPPTPQTILNNSIVVQIDDGLQKSPSPSIRSDEKSPTSPEDVSKLHPDEVPAHWTPEAEKKLMRKIDFTLIPWLTLLYLLSFLDRSSIGNASLYHMSADLHMTNDQYLWALAIFFFSYAIFEIPSNLLLKRLKPHFWLSLLMVTWGIVMTVQGLVHDWRGLMAVRWCLGVAEAGLFPGVNYYLSCWYKRSEFGLRAAIFFSAATGSGAFGGLLAAAISNMDGIGNKPAWAWIFIIEGLITVVVGAVSFWIIQDFPDSARFLTEDEREFVIARLQNDDQFSAGGEKLRARHVVAAFKDWKTFFGMLCWASCATPMFAFSLFTPSIISQLGYTATTANLLSVPIWVLSSAVTVLVGYLADRTGHRGYYNLIFASMGVIGFIILIVSRSAALSYFAVYLAAAGMGPCVPNTIAWISNNVEGSYKRSVSIALIIGFGNLNGAVSSNVYRAKWRPWYRPGHIIILGYICMGMASSLILMCLLRRENRLRDEGLRDECIVPVGREKGVEVDGGSTNGTFTSVEEARREKGDKWSGYRYIT